MEKKIKLAPHMEYDGKAFRITEEYQNSQEFKDLLKQKQQMVLEGLKMQQNDFPVRLDEKALHEITNKSSDNDVYVRVNQILPRVTQSCDLEFRRTLAALLALQDYLKERRVDPGFQVVIGE